MKNRLLNSFFRAAAAFALLLAAGACKDDVALPMQRVALNTHAILAPSFATTLSFDVEANCDWTISVAGDDTSWAELSQTEATGMATVAVSIAENNTSGSRALTIRVAAKRNAAVVEELSFVQASATAEGYLSIPDLRKLAADGDYSVTQDVKMRGIVVSSVQDNNYYDNCIALQSALKANCGITLRTDEVLYRKPGEELEIDLKGAVVGVNPETGVMEVKPAADDKVSRTETTQGSLEDHLRGASVGSLRVDVCRHLFPGLRAGRRFAERYNAQGRSVDAGPRQQPFPAGGFAGFLVWH